MPCTTGNENLPSDKSSAKPLLVVYWRKDSETDAKADDINYLSALKIHEIISYLKVYPYQIHKWNIIAAVTLQNHDG